MKRIKITDDLIEELKHLRETTGVGVMSLLRGRRDIPAGLNSSIIQTWIRGTTATARSDQLDYVLHLWRSVTPIIQLDAATIAEINAGLDRTGLTPRALVARIEPPVDGLRAETVARWINGYTRSARQDHIDAVVTRLCVEPDAKRHEKRPYLGVTGFKRRLVFTDEHRNALTTERERTGISQGEMLKYFYRGQSPDGLSGAKISAWINNSPKTVPADLYEWTLAAWKALPDKGSQ